MRNMRHVGFFTFLLIFMSGIATLQAAPIASFDYIETDLGSGLWQYDYTLANLLDPNSDPGVDLYSLNLYFDLAAFFSIVDLPDGWDAIQGDGFMETFSIKPGEPPDGTDIAPGNFLTGFSFQSNYQTGNLPYQAIFFDPEDPENPVIYQGNAPPVPEPTTFVLAISGLVGLALLRRFRAKS